MDIDQLFRSLVWDNLVKAAIKRVFMAVPFLAIGPLGVITKFIIIKIANKIYEVLKETVDLQLIVFKNYRLKKEFDRASVMLKIIAQGKGVDSNEFKDAREIHKKRLSNFVRFAS